FLHGLAHRPAERTPPIIGILLRPARLWENRRVGGRTKAARLTLQVEHSGAQRLRAAIYTDDVAFGHVLNPVPAGRPSRNPLVQVRKSYQNRANEPSSNCKWTDWSPWKSWVNSQSRSSPHVVRR